MNWTVVLNVLVSALVAGALAGATSWQANPTGSWRGHLSVGAVTFLTGLASHLRQSPVPNGSAAPRP